MAEFWNSKQFWAWLLVVNSLLGAGLALFDDIPGAIVSIMVAAGCGMMMLLRSE